MRLSELLRVYKGRYNLIGVRSNQTFPQFGEQFELLLDTEVWGIFHNNTNAFTSLDIYISAY